MELWKSLTGMLDLQLTSADLPGAMREINRVGVPVYDAVWMDDLTVMFRLKRSDYRKLRKITDKRGERLELAGHRGGYWILKGILRRPVLLAGMLLILF